ncbi:MAG: MmgE/PrpD family protein [Deltaproteobacteria bacterium]|nr:MmgE/PrpD family protein [Deltaproteobacteria bacterium]
MKGHQAMDIAHKLAGHVVNAGYRDIPEDVARTTKTFILDTIGTIMAGSSDPCCSEIVKLIQVWGGKEESSILVFGDRVPSIHAAYVNSMMAHALDFDDTYGYDLKTNKKDGGHANSSVVPASLAAAEINGRVSGKAFITAVATGVDLMLRLGFTLKGGRGWTRSAICGVFGAAAAAGYLLNLNEREMFNAFGIAYSQASGNQQAIIDKALVKRMQPAVAAKSGLFSVLLAQRGVTGAEDIFQGKFGFFNLYSAGEYDLAPLLVDLGKKYEGANLGIKPYPCGRLIHPAIDGALELLSDNAVTAEEIKEVVVRVPERTFYLVGAPFEIKDDLSVRVQFSIPYGVSVAIVRRQVSMEDFLDEARMRDPRIAEMAGKVKVVVDVDQAIEYSAKLPVTVEVITAARGKFVKRVERIHGDPNDPLSPEEFRRKITSCARYAARPELSDRIGEIIETTNRLEDVSNVGALISLLT